MGTKEIIKNSKNSFLVGKIQPGSGKKSDTWVQKRSSKIAKTVFLLEKFNQEVEESGSYQ